jgi:hypothetical protein
MKTARSIAILCLLVFLIVPFAIAQFTAKDHHKKGEELLKQNQLFAAYDERRGTDGTFPLTTSEKQIAVLESFACPSPIQVQSELY